MNDENLEAPELCEFCGYTYTDPRHIERCKPIKYPDSVAKYLEAEVKGLSLVKALTGFDDPVFFCKTCGSMDTAVKEKRELLIKDKCDRCNKSLIHATYCINCHEVHAHPIARAGVELVREGPTKIQSKILDFLLDLQDEEVIYISNSTEGFELADLIYKVLEHKEKAK